MSQTLKQTGLEKLQEYRNKSGLELYQDGHVLKCNRFYLVKSASEADKSYMVIDDTCDCPDFVKRGNILKCKHICSVEYYIKNTPLLLIQ